MTQGESDPYGNTGDKNWDAMIAADRAVHAGEWPGFNLEEPVGFTEGVKDKTGLVFVDDAYYQGWFPADAIPGMQESHTMEMTSISSPPKINEPLEGTIPELFDKNRYDQRDPANTPDAYGRFDEAQMRVIPREQLDNGGITEFEEKMLIYKGYLKSPSAALIPRQ